MKASRTPVVLCTIMFLIFALQMAQAQVLLSREIQNVQVLGSYFTSAISNSDNTASVNDPTKGRYLMLVLTGSLTKHGGKFFTSDFMLQYAHDDNSEDRSRCSALAVCQPTADKTLIGDQEFAIGDYAWAKADLGSQQMTLAFYLEPDVKVVDLYMAGVSDPIIYRVGSDRTVSVYVASNVDDATTSQAEAVLEQGGYNVIEVSHGLNSGQSGISIHYREAMESQAREISQRLMTAFNKTPTLLTMDVLSEVDIVVWIGK